MRISMTVSGFDIVGRNINRRFYGAVEYAEHRQALALAQSGRRIARRWKLRTNFRVKKNVVFARHPHFVEYGTKDRYTRAGAFRGRVVARRTLRPISYAPFRRAFLSRLKKGV